MSIRNTTRLACVLVGLLLLCVGCGKGGGGETVEIGEVGISLTLPPGWKSEAGYERGFYDPAKRDDSWGQVTVFPLEGKTLAAFVDNSFDELEKMEATQKKLVTALGEAAGADLEGEIAALPETRVVSRTPCTIGGREAIVVVYEADYTIMEAFIGRQDNVISVTFRCLKEDFPACEPAFRAAIESVRVN